MKRAAFTVLFAAMLFATAGFTSANKTAPCNANDPGCDSRVAEAVENTAPCDANNTGCDSRPAETAKVPCDPLDPNCDPDDPITDRTS